MDGHQAGGLKIFFLLFLREFDASISSFQLLDSLPGETYPLPSSFFEPCLWSPKVLIRYLDELVIWPSMGGGGSGAEGGASRHVALNEEGEVEVHVSRYIKVRIGCRTDFRNYPFDIQASGFRVFE